MNIIKPFRNIYLSITYSILIIIGSILWWNFSNIELMIGNYGYMRTYFDVGLSLTMILGFPLFLIGIIYKGLLFGKFGLQGSKTPIGMISGTIGTILTGCSCCTITLASYLGFLPFLSLLPYEGLEIKILGTIGLIWALWSTYRDLESCSTVKFNK